MLRDNNHNLALRYDSGYYTGLEIVFELRKIEFKQNSWEPIYGVQSFYPKETSVSLCIINNKLFCS